LVGSTGDPIIDDIVRKIVGVFETAFPGRIASYYVVGSYAYRDAVALSDIDLRVIFEGEFLGDHEVEKFLQVRQECRLDSPVQIDLPPLSEARLYSDENWLHEALGIKTSGVLLYGRDLRDRLPMPDLDSYLRNYTEAPVMFMGSLRRQTTGLAYPLGYPNPHGPFYGYDESERQTSTQMMVLMAGYATTCLIAMHTGEMVNKKSDWIASYKTHVGDAWTLLLENIYGKCRLEWGYRIPESEPDRRMLRELCRKTLAFENYYLLRYREYLLTELRSGDADRGSLAIARFKDVSYPDNEVATVLESTNPESDVVKSAPSSGRPVSVGRLGSPPLPHHSIFPASRQSNSSRKIPR